MTGTAGTPVAIVLFPNNRISRASISQQREASVKENGVSRTSRRCSMLVLSRKRGERIIISDQEIVVTVLEVRGEQVRLGISAPPNVSVHRQEIWARIKSEKEALEPPLEAVES